MKTTFLNGDESLRERGLQALRSYAEDLEFFMDYPVNDLDDLREMLRDKDLSFAEIRKVLQKYDEVGAFFEYGLSFDFVEAGTFEDQKEPYYRYQLAWGGPSAEIRFYQNRTEFVFLDWFVGVGFDVSDEPWAQWLNDYFTEIDMIQEDRFFEFA